MGRTTIAIKDQTKTRFIKVKGTMQVKNGQNRTEDDVLNELIDAYIKLEKVKI